MMSEWSKIPSPSPHHTRRLPSSCLSGIVGDTNVGQIGIQCLLSNNHVNIGVCHDYFSFLLPVLFS